MKAKHLLPELKGEFKSLADVRAALRNELRARGIPHADAQKDERGFCLTCGKSLMCVGVHTFEEIQEAAKAEKAKAV
jgi:hypothetical protein